MLSPEQRAALEYLKTVRHPLLKTSTDAEASNHAMVAFNRHNRLIQIAITALTNEAALAEQVRGLREALEAEESARGEQMPDVTASQRLSMIRLARIKRSAALTLTIPEAAQQAAENAERAGLLEELIAAIRQGQDKGSDESDIAHSIAKAEGIIAKAEALRAAKEADRG